MASKTMAAVLTILEEADTPTHRTKLVKLVYLADNLFYEHFGRTITGLEYMWDEYGPNAISNAIVKEADRLVEKDSVCLKVGTSIYGSENYLYSLAPKKTEISERLLTPLERQVLHDTVERYRKSNITEIVAASKRTRPFKDARQYQLLKLNQSSEYMNLLNRVRSDDEFMAGVTEGIKPDAEAEGMRMQEVRQKYGV